MQCSYNPSSRSVENEGNIELTTCIVIVVCFPSVFKPVNGAKGKTSQKEGPDNSCRKARGGSMILNGLLGLEKFCPVGVVYLSLLYSAKDKKRYC